MLGGLTPRGYRLTPKKPGPFDFNFKVSEWRSCECGAELIDVDYEFVCSSCSRVSTVAITPSAQTSDGSIRCYNAPPSKSVDRLKSAFEYLRGKANGRVPKDILRASAVSYAALCDELRSNGVNGKRCNTVIAAILKQEFDKANISRTVKDICSIFDIKKSALTGAINKLDRYVNQGLTTVNTIQVDRIPIYTYQFLIKLGANHVERYTPVVVDIIRVASDQTRMIDYRLCHDRTRVISVIWLIFRQLGAPISHSVITSRIEPISKSTYMKYNDFLVKNRKIINVELVRNHIPPIPRTTKRTTGVLKPLKLEHRLLFHSERLHKWK